MISGSDERKQVDALEQYDMLKTTLADIMESAGYEISDKEQHELVNSVLYHVLGEESYLEYLRFLKLTSDKSHLH